MVAKYRENKTRERGQRPVDYFANAFGLLQKETCESQLGILGGIFEAKISLGEHGQFFTPFNVADMMAQMIAGEVQKPGETVCDPCSGSGRLLISYSKLNKDARFYGIDISPTCAKMTALNMWLFDLDGDIYHGDSLAEKYFHVWKVRKGGFIYESEIKEDSPKPPSVKKSIHAKAEQQKLFNFEDLLKQER